MTSDSGDSLRKLDDILAKMDVLITAKNEMLTKLNKLELAQRTIITVIVFFVPTSFRTTHFRTT